MHEISLCENIREIIQDEATKSGFTRVRRVWLAVGPLSCVEPEALRFGFDAVMRGSVAEGATVEITIPPAEARCLTCQRVETIAQRYDPCPHCGAGPMEMIRGDELRISKLEVI